MRWLTDFEHHTSIMTHMTYLISNRRAIAFALGRVRLTLVTNTHGAKTDSTAKEQQNDCENALADRFCASHISIIAHMTYLLSNRQAIAFALGRVRLTLVTNTHGAKTDSTAKEQQNECENALVD